MSEYPLVSVIVSSYNRPRLIRDALDSVLAQTWPTIQVIVADDWSDNVTLEVVTDAMSAWIVLRMLDGDVSALERDLGHPERCKEIYARWKALGYELPRCVQPPTKPTSHERQFGQRLSVCINAAMPYASGDFVCFLPDDDFLTPQSIEVRTRYLMEHPEVNCVYGRLEACKSRCPHSGVHFVAGVGADSDPVGSACTHNENSFYSRAAIARAANRVDHGMMMVRRVPNLPAWPESRTGETRDGEVSIERLGDWVRTGECFDCPDAGWFFRLELAGLGPFHSVSDVVVVKRYTRFGHRTDPSRRE